MKYLKMLGLAAVAAMALMAFVASSASATTLWSGGTQLVAGTTTLASLSSGSSAKLKDTSGNVLVTCTAGTVHGTTKNTSGTSIESNGEVTVTWGEAGTACSSTTDTLKGGTQSITYSSGINGTVKSFGAEVTVSIFGVSCVYGTSASGTTLGTLNGSTTGDATLAINTAVEKKSGGFLCPETTIWEANYTVTKSVYNGKTYTPLHVTS